MIFIGAICGIFFISIVWGALFFFKANTASARKAKFFISLVNPPAMVYTLYALANSAPSDTEVFAFSALTLMATTVFWWAYMTTRNETFDFAFSSAKPAKINTAGPYLWVRHPFYFSYITGWVAPCVITKSSYSIALSLFMTFIYWAAAKKEEKAILSSSSGGLYAAYAERVGMLFPCMLLKRSNIKK